MRKEVILVALIAISALLITPVFAAVFTIDATSGPNGTIDPYGPQTVEEGSYPWFTITPDQYYHIDAVFIDGIQVDSVPAVTIPDVANNHSIYATFALDRFDIVASAGPGGTISPSGTSTYDAQSSATYFISPQTGYHIVDVTVDGVSQGAVSQYTFSEIDASHTISVEFAIDQFFIIAEASGPGNISPEGSVLVDYGSSQTFIMEPEIGYHVEQLVVDGSPVTPANEWTFPDVTGDHTISVAFEIDTFTIETTWGPNGAISPSNPTVVYGESVFLDILPQTGYHIQSVVADGIPADSVPKFPFLEVTNNHSLYASFEPDQFLITPIETDNGNISPSTPQLVSYGNDSPEFIITPDPGFHTTHVFIDGEPFGPLPSYMFTDVQADHNISASFAIDTYTITPVAGPHGTIDPSGPVTVDFQGSQLFTFHPDPCYHVDDVFVNGEPQGSIPEYLFTDVIENASIEVLFAINTSTISVSSGPHGSVSPPGDQTVSCHASMPFTFLPDTGYKVTDVIVNGASVGSRMNYTFTDVTTDQTLAVVFGTQTFTILANAGAHGSISGPSTVVYGESPSYTITPDTGYQVDNVFVDGTPVGAVTELTLPPVTADHSILALFEIATYTINATAGTGGSISPPGITTVSYGGSQSYTVTPNTGYTIANVYVNGNPQGAIPAYTFTDVKSDQTIRAEFAIRQFTITATAGPGGSIAPSGLITINYGGSQTFLIAADPGFGIQNVFVDGVSVGRNSTLMINNIIRNHTVNAFFVQPPVANFTGTPTIGTVPLTVQFTDSSTNNPSVWIWDLGDGTFSSDPNPVHTYNLPGVYNVSLKVINAAGNNTLTRTGYITVSRLPFAAFTAEPTTGTVPLAVQFTDTSDGNPFLWVWKFGDGTISTDQNPVHIYTAPGTYSVTLSVQNVVGGNSLTKVNLITVLEKPVADFSANRTGGVAPVAVQFYDHSTGTGPISRFWDFGDNHTSLEENPVHVYENAGVYTVRLFVTNPVGTDTKVRTGFIVLTAPLGASFTAVPADGDVPLTVVFTDTSTDNPFSWTWNFGDGTYSTEQNPIHTYVRPGTYNVTLSVLSLTGSSSATKQVTVDNPPKASFKANPTAGTDPLTVQFLDTSTGNPTDWEWSFGNGDIALHVRNPVYTYNEPGTYSVVLHVVKGEQDDFAIKTNYITVLPQSFP